MHVVREQFGVKGHRNLSFVTSENQNEIFVNIASIISVNTGTSLFLSLPYISSIVFLVTEEEPGVIYLRHSFPNKIKVLSKLVQRIISFTNFHAQFFIH